MWSWWSSFTILQILWKQVVVSCEFLSRLNINTYWWQDMNSHDTVKNETSKIRLPILWIFRSFKILTLEFPLFPFKHFQIDEHAGKREKARNLYGGDSWHSWQLIINSGISDCPFPCVVDHKSTLGMLKHGKFWREQYFQSHSQIYDHLDSYISVYNSCLAALAQIIYYL